MSATYDFSDAYEWNGEPAPTPHEPRFAVVSCNRFSESTGNSKPPASVYSVVDRACCHRVIRAYTQTGRRAAERCADKLNRTEQGHPQPICSGTHGELCCLHGLPPRTG